MYFYILIDKSALQSFLQAQKGNAVMHNILRPICIAMFVESSGVGASPNPLDSEADSNCTTTDGTSENNKGSSDNTLTSISFGSATPPASNSAENVTSENNSIIGPFGVVGDVRYAVKIG